MNDYISLIKREFPYNGKAEIKYLRSFTQSIIEAGNDDLSCNELMLQYGEPSDIALQYFKDTSLRTYKRKISLRRVLIPLSVCVLAMTAIMLVSSFKEGRKSYIGREVIEIREIIVE